MILARMESWRKQRLRPTRAKDAKEGRVFVLRFAYNELLEPMTPERVAGGEGQILERQKIPFVLYYDIHLSHLYLYLTLRFGV